jgi:hypothetical protein
MEPQTFRITNRTARPIVRFDRQPGPNRFSPELISNSRAIGPLTIIRTAGPDVVVLGRDHDRHVLRFAPRQHGVDRNFFGGNRNLALRDKPDHLVRSEPRRLQHFADARLRGRHHRKPIAPVLAKAKLDRVAFIGKAMPVGQEF